MSIPSGFLSKYSKTQATAVVENAVSCPVLNTFQCFNTVGSITITVRISFIVASWAPKVQLMHPWLN